MTESTYFVQASDGTRLAVRRWNARTSRATVLIVHGLGEHAGRYADVAAWLAQRGVGVVAYDHRGHGNSDGRRGVIGDALALQSDLQRVVITVRDPATPFLLLGHSMGGAVAARAVATSAVVPEGLLLTSPAFAAELTALQRLQLTLGALLAPSLARRNALDVSKIAHDAAVVRAYLDDPLVHDRITARLARAILEAGRVALAHAPHWRVPTLLLYSGDDHLVDARGSDAFAAAAPRGIVETERYDALYHEILNEGHAAAPVYARIERWLDARFPPPVATA